MVDARDAKPPEAAPARLDTDRRCGCACGKLTGGQQVGEGLLPTRAERRHVDGLGEHGHIAIGQIQQRMDISDGEFVPAATRPDDCVSRLDAPFGDHAKIEARAVMCDKQIRHVRLAEPHAHPEARHPRLGHFEVAFGWRAVDAFYEEDERIVGNAADPYHRVDIRATSRHLVVRDGDRVVADTHRPVVLYESGFAPRWYVYRDDIDQTALESAEGQTFCPYKGLADYYTIGEHKRAAWSYANAWPEAGRVSNLVSFEPDQIDVWVDDRQLHLEPGQTVVAHGIDRGLDADEVVGTAARSA